MFVTDVSRVPPDEPVSTFAGAGLAEAWAAAAPAVNTARAAAKAPSEVSCGLYSSARVDRIDSVCGTGPVAGAAGLGGYGGTWEVCRVD